MRETVRNERKKERNERTKERKTQNLWRERSTGHQRRLGKRGK